MMAKQPGQLLGVLFRAVGDDDRILTAHEVLAGEPDSPPVAKGTVRYGSPSPHHFCSIVLPLDADDQQSAMEQALVWLEQHRETLLAIQADKWLEFGSGLMPEQAYEAVSFPVPLLAAACEAGCRLVNTCYGIVERHDSMYRRQIAAMG